MKQKSWLSPGGYKAEGYMFLQYTPEHYRRNGGDPETAFLSLGRPRYVAGPGGSVGQTDKQLDLFYTNL